MKTCTGCLESKPLEQFWKSTTFKDGHNYRCISCMKTRYQTRRKSNPTARRDHQRKYRENPRNRLRDLLCRAKARSLKANLPFDLDLDWLCEQWENQNGCCKLTGFPFVLKSEQRGRFNRLAPSLDRIDPKSGYTKDNVRLVCTCINIALNEWGEDAFKALATAYLLNCSHSPNLQGQM